MNNPKISVVSSPAWKAGDLVTVHVQESFSGIPNGSNARVTRELDSNGTVGILYEGYDVGELFTSGKNLRPRRAALGSAERPTPTLWVTMDRRFGGFNTFARKGQAEAFASEEPAMIDVVEYVPRAEAEQPRFTQEALDTAHAEGKLAGDAEYLRLTKSMQNEILRLRTQNEKMRTAIEKVIETATPIKVLPSAASPLVDAIYLLADSLKAMPIKV